ncbi:MAG: type III-B CRISPR module RAMP protein Cmr1, partial [Verrucomicrobiota bacterium]
MKPETYNLTFLTPCFCAGADQAVAELRPSAIRGQLRWWFRALGGTYEQEAAVFGAAADDQSHASSLQVRTRLVQRGQDWKPFQMSPGQPGAYVWFFASVASEKKRWWKRAPGPRNQPPGIYNPQGNLPPQTQFQIHLRRLRPVSDTSAEELLRVAVRSLLRFGGVGMRLTRGMGAWECAELTHVSQAIRMDADEITRRGFEVKFGNGGFATAQAAILDGEKW